MEHSHEELEVLKERYGKLVKLKEQPFFQLTAEEAGYVEELRRENEGLMRQVEEMLREKQGSGLGRLRQKLEEN